MMAESALVEVQCMVVDSPSLICVRSAQMETVGRGIVVTFTVVLSWAVPAAPVAVMVYAVVVAGDTICDPVMSTAPMPGSMVQELAFSALQVSVVELPA